MCHLSQPWLPLKIFSFSFSTSPPGGRQVAKEKSWGTEQGVALVQSLEGTILTCFHALLLPLGQERVSLAEGTEDTDDESTADIWSLVPLTVFRGKGSSQGCPGQACLLATVT